jgi:hypothetical protein
MSYSRWKDDRYFPLFRDGFMAQHSQIDAAGLDKARDYNAQRYYFQGIGRYAPDQAYARGLADLQVLADLIPADGYVHGAKPTSIDAGIYGFIANIHYLPIPTPLKAFVSDHRNLVRHCEAIPRDGQQVGSLRRLSESGGRHCEERQRRSNPCLGKWRNGLLRSTRNDAERTVSKISSGYLNVIAKPLKSAFAISPVCWPASSSTAPFWLVSTMARAPRPIARPAPAAP